MKKRSWKSLWSGGLDVDSVPGNAHKVHRNHKYVTFRHFGGLSDCNTNSKAQYYYFKVPCILEIASSASVRPLWQQTFLIGYSVWNRIWFNRIQWEMMDLAPRVSALSVEFFGRDKFGEASKSPPSTPCHLLDQRISFQQTPPLPADFRPNQGVCWRLGSMTFQMKFWSAAGAKNVMFLNRFPLRKRVFSAIFFAPAAHF